LAFSYWTDKPWFLTEGKFATVLIIPSSWGSQLDGDLYQHRAASAVKQRFLDAAPIKCVGLDCEFTSPREGRRNQRAAVLQLLVASEVLVFQICRADHVPQLLKDFLKDPTIRFYGAAIDNDVRMLKLYGIEISSVYDL
jgi:hypothetical protein